MVTERGDRIVHDLHDTQTQNETNGNLFSKWHLKLPCDDDGNRQYRQICHEIDCRCRYKERALVDAFASFDREVIDIRDGAALENVDEQDGNEKPNHGDQRYPE